MEIALKPDLESLVRERVARGDYESADALVEAAVARLMEDDGLAEDMAEVRARIARADREFESGEFVEYDAGSIGDLAREIHSRRE